MKNIWKFEDIIDLEYFSNLDLFSDDQQEKDFHRRERQFFLDGQRKGELRTASHFQCLASWLSERRLAESKVDPCFIPGSKLEGSLRLFQWLLLICGLLLGSAMGLSYFVYTGQTPLNVFTFFTIYILPQLGLIVLFLLRTTLARLIMKPRSFVQRVLLHLYHRFATFFKKRTLGHLEKDQQQSFNALFSGKNSSLITWPLFLQAQLFGVAVNVGLLLITLFKIATVDLAFGWQTTLQLGAEGLNSLVQFVALPWSWLLPEQISAPTLAQIEGSRIILKDGIYHLTTENLTSWWPFLLLSLLCYGLLPRLVLLLFGFFAEKRCLRRYLEQRKFLIITERMRTPLVSSQADVERQLGEVTNPKRTSGGAATIKQKEKNHNCRVLVPDELYDNLSHTELDRLLFPHGYEVKEKTHLFTNYEDDNLLLEEIDQEKDGLIVLIEAWMPPIVEHLLFLEKLSQRLNTTASLVFCLLGKPSSERIITRPHRDAAQLWKEKLLQCCDTALIFEPEEPMPKMEGER